MAFKITKDGKITVETNPIITKESFGVVSLANNQIQVNEKNLVQEIRKQPKPTVRRVTIILEILCDYTIKGGDET